MPRRRNNSADCSSSGPIERLLGRFRSCESVHDSVDVSHLPAGGQLQPKARIEDIQTDHVALMDRSIYESVAVSSLAYSSLFVSPSP